MIADRHKGAANEMAAIAWLLKRGYEVFRNVSQHGPIDLIAYKDGVTLLLDVKSKKSELTKMKPEQYAIGVRFIAPENDGFIIFEQQPPELNSCKKCGKLCRRHYCSSYCRKKTYNETKKQQKIRRSLTVIESCGFAGEVQLIGCARKAL